MKKILTLSLLILFLCGCIKPILDDQLGFATLYQKQKEGYSGYLIRFTEWKDQFLSRGLIISDIYFVKLDNGLLVATLVFKNKREEKLIEKNIKKTEQRNMDTEAPEDPKFP